jgi:hypothetical protein
MPDARGGVKEQDAIANSRTTAAAAMQAEMTVIVMVKYRVRACVLLFQSFVWTSLAFLVNSSLSRTPRI